MALANPDLSTASHFKAEAGLGLVSRWLIMSGVGLIATQKGMVAVVGALLVLSAIGLRPAIARQRFPLVLAVLLFWCCLSLLWTTSVSTTIDEIVRAIAIAAAAWALARTCRPRQAGRLLAGGFTLVCSVSLAWGILNPSVAFDDEGLLRGVISHPNGLALIAAAALVCGLLNSAGNHRFAVVAATLINGAALVLSGSLTSTLAACVAVALGLLLGVVRQVPDRSKAIELLTFGAVALLAAIAIVQNLPAVAASVGRDVTLTGRTTLWGGIWTLIQEHPVVGFGLGAPWAAGSYPREYMAKIMGFNFISAHNGFLDAFLQLGGVGLVLFAIMLWVAIRYWLPVSLRGGGTSFGFGVLTLLIVANIAETTFMIYTGWLLLSYVYCASGEIQRDATESSRVWAPPGAWGSASTL